MHKTDGKKKKKEKGFGYDKNGPKLGLMVHFNKSSEGNKHTERAMANWLKSGRL